MKKRSKRSFSNCQNPLFKFFVITAILLVPSYLFGQPNNAGPGNSKDEKKKIGTEPYELIEVDLQKGLMPSKYIPFDVPFVLKVLQGKLDMKTIESVNVRFAESKYIKLLPDGCFPTVTSDALVPHCKELTPWRANEITRNSDNFYLEVPELKSNTSYRFYFLVKRVPDSVQEVAIKNHLSNQIARIVDDQIGKLNPGYGEIDLTNALNLGSTHIQELLKRSLNIYLMRELKIVTQTIPILEQDSTDRFRVAMEYSSLSDAFVARERALYHKSRYLGDSSKKFNIDEAQDQYAALYGSPVYANLRQKKFDLFNQFSEANEDIANVVTGQTAYNNSYDSKKAMGEVKRNATEIDPYIANLTEYSKYLRSLSEYIEKDIIPLPNGGLITYMVASERENLGSVEKKKADTEAAAGKLEKALEDQSLNAKKQKAIEAQLADYLNEIVTLERYIETVYDSFKLQISKFSRSIQSYKAVIDAIKNQDLVRYKGSLTQIDNVLTGVVFNLYQSLKINIAANASSVSSADYVTATEWYVSADVGIAYFNFRNDFINDFQPYIGVNFNFAPINRQRPYTLFSRDGFKRFHKNLSGVIGITLNAIETNDGGREDLWSDMSLITGIGVRISGPVRLSGGFLWMRKSNDNPVRDTKELMGYPYFSLSFDVDVKKYLGAVGNKLFGDD